MDRVTTYFGALARARDILDTNQNAMVGLAKLTEAVLGTQTLVDGFTCGAEVPATLNVIVGPGTIYQQAPLESSTLSALQVDTHSIIKQGMSLDSTTLTLTPPITIGQAVNVLIQVQYQDLDAGQVVLNYYNAADPTTPLRGPANNGQPQSTVRKGVATIAAKYGVPATAGTQSTPNPDAGWAGLHVVTISFGQTAISAGNITRFASVPLIAAKLGEIPQAVQSNTWNYAIDTGTSGLSIQAILFPVPLAIYDGFRCSVKLARDVLSGASLSVNGTSGTLLKPGNVSIGPSDYRAGDILDVVRNGTVWIVTSSGNSLSVIDTAIVRTVGGSNSDFADLATAFSWLSRRRILPIGSVTFKLPAGVGVNKLVQTTPITFSHENGDRVFIQGAPLNGPIPNPALMTYSGNSPAARASDTAANLTALRAAFGTEILFANGAKFTVIGNLGNLQDLLLTSDQTGVGIDLLTLTFGVQTISRIATVNAQLAGIQTINATTYVNGTNIAMASGGQGWRVTFSGYLQLLPGATVAGLSNTLQGILAGGHATIGMDDTSATGPVLYSRGNGNRGIEANGGNIISSTNGVSRDNNGEGWFISNPGVIRAAGCVASGNIGSGMAAFYGSFFDATNATGSGNTQFGTFANLGAEMIRSGATVTGNAGSSSPAVNTVGNSNSFIVG